jgi:hypothetical protein
MNSRKIGAAIAWETSQPIVELYRVLGKLHSSQGLSQSNNNAKLNYSAKHETTLLETSGKQRR